MDMNTKKGMLEYCKNVAEKNNWLLNKDKHTLDELIDGLVINKNKYGYQSCPCRLASGNRDLDRDLICPCDYVHSDVKEHGTCYCNLYMRSDFYETVDEAFVIVPERRSKEKEQAVIDYLNK